MRIREITIVLRKNGFFHWNGRLIKAVYPREGYAVMLFLESSQIDLDFQEPVLVLSCKDYAEIGRKMRQSDELTWKLRGGKGWTNGPRPYVKLHEFM